MGSRWGKNKAAAVGQRRKGLQGWGLSLVRAGKPCIARGGPEDTRPVAFLASWLVGPRPHSRLAWPALCSVPLDTLPASWSHVQLASFFPSFLPCSNIAEALVSKGLATVIRYRQDDDQRSSHYDELLAAEAR